MFSRLRLHSKSMLSVHAKQRAFERYGVTFSKKDEKSFQRMLANGNNVITLSNGRFVCFFQGRWFVCCRENRVITTFVPPSSLNDSEKWILQNNELYREKNIDTLNILSIPLRHTGEIIIAKKRPRLPSVINAAELPHDFDEAEERLQHFTAKK